MKRNETKKESPMRDLLTRSNVILDSIGDGVYVCDTNRRIVYWSKSAERITGWTRDDVIGRRCLDDVLCHVDKDGHRLCGEEFCPLHRSMITGSSNAVPLIVFAKSKDGKRVPMQVSVAPIRNDDGMIIGGVEIFRDVSAALADLERAKRIQTLSLDRDLPDDSRIRFSTIYTPHDIVGGDYVALRQLDSNHYGFMLADVMGHGIAAALNTMHLSSLWSRFCHMLEQPARFAEMVNNELTKVVKDESFATAVCGIIDARNRRLRVAAAGGPPMVVFHADGNASQIEAPGTPFGMLEGVEYEEIDADLDRGDHLLLFSDGAIEIHNTESELLGVKGLIGILHAMRYPEKAIEPGVLEEELLKFSNAIRLDDDVTLIEASFK
jgi:sigma-B regulation protein RsbU (phosphoserine phosphatase)